MYTNEPAIAGHKAGAQEFATKLPVTCCSMLWRLQRDWPVEHDLFSIKQ
jgi:hypothetical protein